METADLFGGAFQTRLWPSFDDVSRLRPVPDHQEVWVDKGTSNVSFSYDKKKALPVHFNDMARANKADISDVLMFEPDLLERAGSPSTNTSNRT